MTEGKYGKYFVSNPNPYPDRATPPTSEGGVFLDNEILEESRIRLSVRRVFDTRTQTKGPHKHDNDEIILFLAKSNDGDLGSEIEFRIGDEGEKHTFRRTTAVYIPKGLTHAPITSKMYDKTKEFFSITILVQPDYTAHEIK